MTIDKRTRAWIGLAALVGLIGWIVLRRAAPPHEIAAERESSTRVETQTGDEIGAAAQFDESRSPVDASKLQILVVDAADRRPLPDATVELRSNGASPSSATSSATGRASFDMPPPGPFSLSAQRPGYEPRKIEIAAAERADLLRVELRRASGWLRGRVADTLGAPVEGMRVCAWDLGDTPSLRRLADSVRRRESPEARTAADGSFAIELPPDSFEWTCAAAGAGFITPNEPRFDSRERSWIELTAHPVFATRIRWLDEDGGPLRSSSALREGSTPDGALSGVSATTLRGEWSALALLGVDDSELRFIGRDQTLFLFAATTGAPPEVLPLALSKRAPGYEPAQATIEVPRLTAAIPELDFRMSRTSEAFTRVYVRCGDSLGVTPSAEQFADAPSVAALIRSRQTPAVTLHLKRTDASVSCAFALWSFEPELQELGGVPCGDYVLWWTADCGAVPPTPTDVRIEGDTLVLTAPTKKLGSALATIDGPTGAPFEGLVTLQVDYLGFSRSDPDVAFVSFVEAPYRLDGLSPGPYVIRVKHPPSLAGLSSSEFNVRAGETTPLSLGR